MGRNIQTKTMQHVKKTRETPHSLLLKAASMWSNRSSKVSMFIATKFMNRIPVESGQLTSYSRQDVEWLEGSTGNSQEPRLLISLQTISFVSQTLIERMDQRAFLLNIFLSWGSFSCLKKEGEPWGRGCIGGSLGTLRSDNGRRQWKCRWKIDFTFFEFFSPLYQVSQLLDGWNWREGTASEIREG